MKVMRAFKTKISFWLTKWHYIPDNWCSKSTVDWVCWWWTPNTIVCFSQSFWYMY